MPEEPNHNMDAMLRAYAKKRGEARLEPLHPATRRMLQEEARRVHGPAPDRRKGWAFWWPRLAFASSLCLVAMLTVAVLRVDRPPESASSPQQADKAFADESSSPPPEVSKDLAKEVADDTPSAPSLLRQQVKLKEEQPATVVAEEKRNLAPDLVLREQDELKSPAAVGLTTTAPAESLLVLKDAAADQERVQVAKTARDDSPAASSLALAPAPAIAPTAAPAQAGARPESLARATEMTNLGAALRTKFVQTDQPAAPVLRAFQMEQLGETLRLVDLDGSIYTGQIQRAASPASPLAVSAQRTALGRAMPALQSSPGASNNQAIFSFTANGVSRTLGAPVLVQGHYFRATNAPASEPASAARPARARESQSVLFGRTLVGGSNEAPLRAISVDR